MFLRRSEKRGIIFLSVMILALFVLPLASRERECPLFLLTPPATSDTTGISRAKPFLSPIELNTADSSTLVKIRGIGSYYAAKIIRYRERLGGFHSPKQLKEIKFQYLNIDTLLARFTANPSLIRQKDLDTMTFKAILKHPYLAYEDVQLIFNAKRKFGKINFSILNAEKILPLYKLQKIKPYFK
jgi:hypothetical protein